MNLRGYYSHISRIKSFVENLNARSQGYVAASLGLNGAWFERNRYSFCGNVWTFAGAMMMPSMLIWIKDEKIEVRSHHPQDNQRERWIWTDEARTVMFENAISFISSRTSWPGCYKWAQQSVELMQIDAGWLGADVVRFRHSRFEARCTNLGSSHTPEMIHSEACVARVDLF